MNADLLVNLLSESELIDQNQATDLLDEHTRTGKNIEDIVTDYGLIERAALYQLVAEYLGTEVVDISDLEFPPELLSLIPGNSARLHGALPLEFDGQTIRVALTDPLDQRTVDSLQFSTGKEIQIFVSSPQQIQTFIDRYYGSDTADLSEILQELENDLSHADLKDLDSELEAASSQHVIKYVNAVLAQAIKARASDIHFEPFEVEFKIRYRVDGALYEMSPPPRSLATAVTARLKVMSNLNIAERRVPQDGRIQTMMAGRQVDLRVSTLPTQFGESVVLRVLDRSTVSLELEALGLPENIFGYIAETIEKPNGIFIVTGPTGSGKTTTLYACLNRINRIESKLLTAEDPVEFEIEGIQQVAINDNINLTFARVLRAFLRQDPDRILIGETRDLQTAQIAVQASLTGHLVFTTLHTNDSPGAIARLIDMGVEPFLIGSTLEAVLGQRLVRKVCSNCRTPYEPNESVLEQIGLSPHEVGDQSFYYGAGCEECNNTGYRGRQGIFELLDVTEPIRQLINQRAPTVVMRQKAIELGMTTLRQDGIRAIFDGITSIEEVLRYT